MKNVCLYFAELVGSAYLELASIVGRLFLFKKNLLYHLFFDKFFLTNLKTSFIRFGYCSIPISSLTALFAGGVLALQLHSILESFGVNDLIPKIVFISLIKELGPILLGLMFTARSGSSMTAEIAGMKVNNQLDSLFVMSANPFSFLFLPRVLSSVLFAPILLFVSVTIGLLGSMIVSYILFDFSFGLYLVLLSDVVAYADVKVGLLKSVVFITTSSFVACYHGYYAQDGAFGIGRSTINSVVSSCVLILFLNLVITFLWTVK